MRYSLLLAAGFVFANGLSALAQVTPEDLQSQLRYEVCLQDWEGAIETTDRLLQTDLGLQRESFLDLRETLVGYQAENAQFASMPGCGAVSDTDWEGARAAGRTRSGDADRPEWYFRGGPWGTYGSGSGSGSSPLGNCVSPDDIDAAGRRCGGRASSVRPGGN